MCKFTLPLVRLLSAKDFIKLSIPFGIDNYHNYISIQHDGSSVGYKMKLCLIFDIRSLGFIA